jgi:hypothetical protein
VLPPERLAMSCRRNSHSRPHIRRVPGQFRAGHSCSHDLRHQGGVIFLVVSFAALELSFMLPLVVDPLVIM